MNRITFKAELATRNVALIALLMIAILAIFSAMPAYSAEPINDPESCKAALNGAEDTIVRADIDSATFRLLNDQLVEMRNLCAQQDYNGAETKHLDVMNAVKDLQKKS